MASMTDFESWEVAMVGNVVEKDLVGIKEEAENARGADVECRIEEEAAMVLL